MSKKNGFNWHDQQSWDAWDGVSTSTHLNGLSMSHHKGSGGHNFDSGRCYNTHPPYPVADGLVIYGGSCRSPIIKDADIYIGFDGSMSFRDRHYPWNPPPTSGPVEVYFHITDHQAPHDHVEFAKMVKWTGEQLQAGRKVHCGCIGGHGRTGTFFAALRRSLTGDVDAGAHVREHYCAKVIEAQSQVDFLRKHFGINKIEPRSYSSSKSYKGNTKPQPTYKTSDGLVKDRDDRHIYQPLIGANSIWGKKPDKASALQWI